MAFEGPQRDFPLGEPERHDMGRCVERIGARQRVFAQHSIEGIVVLERERTASSAYACIGIGSLQAACNGALECGSCHLRHEVVAFELHARLCVAPCSHQRFFRQFAVGEAVGDRRSDFAQRIFPALGGCRAGQRRCGEEGQ